MELTVWTYEGPPHVGAMRIATSMEGVHYVLHAPQGDTYADLLFTMIERRNHRPRVSYTTFQARDLGGDTASLVQNAVVEAYERFSPRLLLVGESCTAELIQDQPGSLAQGMNLPVPVVALELPSYSKKENWGASETFYALVRTLLLPHVPDVSDVSEASDVSADPARGAAGAEPTASAETRSGVGSRPSVNLLGPTSLGFRCRDDVEEITKLLGSIGVDVNVVAPLGASPEDILRLPEADANVCLYPEVAQTVCQWLDRKFGQPFVKTVPIGVGATREFVAELASLLQLEILPGSPAATGDSRLPWYSRSVDSTYLTDKRVFIFGDATHVLAAARMSEEELGFKVVGVGTYSREFAREVRAIADKFDVEALITDDYLAVEQRVIDLQPELVLGTQMERHVCKRLGIPCAVISAPVHVQDFPARYSPQMGFEGANVLFDTLVHPLLMGLEEHLLGMFRDDFEFNDEVAPSHLGHSATRAAEPAQSAPARPERTEDAQSEADSDGLSWTEEASRELQKIPFFVRGKARRNTERYAKQQAGGLGNVVITLETLYDAKAHFGR